MSRFSNRLVALAVFLLVAFLSVGAALPVKEKSGPPVPTLRKNSLSPLPAKEKAVSSHAPFEAGDCSICHKSADRNAPGPITAAVNDQCLGSTVKVFERPIR